ncbi:MAG: IS110 family transposase [Methanosarcinaceae archaeon]
MSNSIGIDISKSLISVYIPIICLYIEIENSQKGFKILISKLKKQYKKEFIKLVFVFEPTGNYSAPLTQFCSEKKINCFIINPKQSANFAKANGDRSKTDKADAKMLSKAIVLAKDGEIKVPTYDLRVEEMKELMSFYKFTVISRVRISNHLESLTAKNGSLYAIDELEKELAKYKLKEKEINSKLLEIIKKDKKLQEGFENILSVKGIGEKTAVVLLHLFIKYPDANQRQITSLVGLDPIERSSGTSVRGKSRISKAGASIYRNTMFMGVMTAIRYSKDFQIFFNRLKANGKHTTVAQIAVMRKMLIIAHSLYKNNEQFDGEKYAKNCGRS